MITDADVIAEGFPGWPRHKFVGFFEASHRGCRAWDLVTRIEWKYLEDGNG